MGPLLTFPLASTMSLFRLALLLLARDCHCLKATLCFRWLLQEKDQINFGEKAEGELRLLYINHIKQDLQSREWRWSTWWCQAAGISAVLLAPQALRCMSLLCLSEAGLT